MDYFARIDPLTVSTPSNWLLDQHPDAYLYGTLYNAEIFLDNAPRAAQWKGLLDRLWTGSTGPRATTAIGAGPLVPNTGHRFAARGAEGSPVRRISAGPCRQPQQSSDVAKNVAQLPTAMLRSGFPGDYRDPGAAFVGGGSFASSAGGFTLLAATAAKLRKYVSGAWSDIATGLTISQRGISPSSATTSFTPTAHSGQAYGLITTTATTIATAPSNAIDVATVRDFVMCLTADNAASGASSTIASTWTTGNQPG
jgi:hypothetical protein